MRGAALVNAVGLLKEELRRCGSLVMAAAEVAKVPAGGALAVDREVFAKEVTARIAAHPRIRVEARDRARDPGGDADAAGHPRDGPAHRRRPRGGHRARRRRTAPRVLRRHRADRQRRLHRRVEGLPPVALGQGRARRRERPAQRRPAPASATRATPRRSGRGVHQLPFDEAGYKAFVAAHRRGAEGRAARVRGGPLLRGLPARRGDGVARRDDARLRTDEARRSHESAHRPPPVRRRAAPRRRRGGHRVQPRRLPDAHDVGRPGARAADDPRPRGGGVPSLRKRAPQHVRRRAEAARRAHAAARATERVPRRPDHGRRGLRGELRRRARLRDHARASRWAVTARRRRRRRPRWAGSARISCARTSASSRRTSRGRACRRRTTAASRSAIATSSCRSGRIRDIDAWLASAPLARRA